MAQVVGDGKFIAEMAQYSFDKWVFEHFHMHVLSLAYMYTYWYVENIDKITDFVDIHIQLH